MTLRRSPQASLQPLHTDAKYRYCLPCTNCTRNEVTSTLATKGFSVSPTSLRQDTCVDSVTPHGSGKKAFIKWEKNQHLGCRHEDASGTKGVRRCRATWCIAEAQSCSCMILALFVLYGHQEGVTRQESRTSWCARWLSTTPNAKNCRACPDRVVSRTNCISTRFGCREYDHDVLVSN